MSRHTAQTARDQLFGRPAYVNLDYANGDGVASSVIADLRQLATVTPSQEVSSWKERMGTLVAEYGRSPGPVEKPFAYSDGIAIIPIHGLLLNRFAYSWGFVTGYNFIRNQFNAARNDPDVKLIVFDVNSNGGMCAGCQELSDEIFSARNDKPSIAVVDAYCYSAAYFIASAAGRVIVTPSSGVGSVGVLCMRVDLTKAMDDEGINVTVVYAGKNKLDSNPFGPFSADAQARLQASVDLSYDAFVSAVARNRSLPEEEVRATEASCYGAEEALTLGLIDAILPPIAAVESAVADLEADDDDGEDPNMTTKTPEQLAAETNAQAVAAAQAEARTAERTRISGIQGHAEAKDKAKLAAHLALNTAMSVEDAAEVLKAAAPETPVAAAAPAPAQQPANPFAAAMDGGKNPNVTAEGGATGEQEDPNSPKARASRILAAQSRATGAKLVAVK
jgi:signal peptide peptidase SppA